MVTDEMVEKAVNAALKADIIPADDPKHSGVRINEYLSYTPAEAVELGVQLTQKTEDGKPRWHGFTDIMGDEYDDTNRAILRPVVRAALEASLSEAEKGEKEAKTGWAFAEGDLVRKKSGSWWEGRVVGTYTTEQTPRGYAVQLDKPFGPVQIYPESALESALQSEER